MDVIFDIDGTLANPAHRAHFIEDMAYWTTEGNRPARPDWKRFLSTDQLAKDEPIPQTWALLNALLAQGARVLFITGREVTTRDTTFYWLMDTGCPVRSPAVTWMMSRGKINLFMRKIGDHRPSSVVKEELLLEARVLGYAPTLAFEDREEDAAMWRKNGLVCAQVAEGKF